jgi:hypothetical protein
MAMTATGSEKLAELVAEHERLRAWAAEMQDALLAAAEQFDVYADYHLAKSPPDDDKAAVNTDWASRCRDAAGITQ